MLKLLILISAFALVYGNVVPKTSQGSMNKYYFFSKRNPLTAVPIPTDIEGEPEDEDSVIPEDNNNDGNGNGNETTATTPSDSNEEVDHPLFIDNGKPTMVIVHGHEGDAFSTLNPMVKFELFKAKLDHNVIVVDWSSFTKQNYGIAVSAVASVGTSMGQFLQRLADQRRINATITHLVGFNLGAHVVGRAARQMNPRPARITGLDPSKKQWGSGSGRLSKGDAPYVEVIHTDGNGVLANGIGTAIGNVDFFVNGGGNQPGCFTHQCSHNRAYEVFAATLSRSDRLVGNRCSSNLQVSLNTCRGVTNHIGGIEFRKLATEGSYRVNTRKSFPY